MNDDERAIRELVATWMEASQSGDIDIVPSLMTDVRIDPAGGGQRRGT